MATTRDDDIVVDDLDMNDFVNNPSLDWLNDKDLNEELRLLEPDAGAFEESDHSVLPSKHAELNDSWDLSNFDKDVLAEYKNLEQQLNSSTVSPPPFTTKSSIEDVFSNNVDIEIAQCKSEQVAKSNATRYQRQGDTETALKWFRKLKELKMKSKNNPPSNSNTFTVQSSKLQAPSSSLNPRDTAFQLLEEALDSEVKSYLLEAKRLRESNPKEAVEKMKLYKFYNQELTVLKSRKTIPHCLPPLFYYETKMKECTVERFEIGDDQLKLCLDGVHSIDSKYIGKILLIKYYIGYNSNIDDSLVVGTSSKVKVESNASATFNLQLLFNIVKRSKVPQPSFGRKKARFDIYNSGFFSMTRIGTAILNFNDLLTKTEIGGNIEIFEDDKVRSKKIGGVLKVFIRLRNPIMSPEKKVVEERILKIGKWPETSIGRQDIISSFDVTSNKSSLDEASDASQFTQPAQQSEMINVSLSPTTFGSDIKLTDRELNDPTAVELLESNDVIEHEIVLCKKMLAKTTDESSNFILNLRLQSLLFQLTILQNKVTEGVLTMEVYLDKLRNRIQRDEALKMYLVKSKSEDVIRVQERIDIMKAEIKGVEDSQE